LSNMPSCRELELSAPATPAGVAQLFTTDPLSGDLSAINQQPASDRDGVGMAGGVRACKSDGDVSLDAQ